MRSSQGVFAFMAILVLTGCGGGSDSGTNPDPTPTPPAATPPSASASVSAGSSSDVFSPPDVSVTVGGSVTWTFGARPHDVVFAGTPGAPNNIGVTTNAQVSRTFATVGTFPYDCTLHPGMRGRVLVGVANSESSPGY